MARKKIDEGSIEEQKKVFLCRRIMQIRQTFFKDNNRLFSKKVDINEQTLSQICSGKRNAGIEIVQKIIDNMPEINANWLISGVGAMEYGQTQIEEKPTSAQPQEQSVVVEMLREMIREKEAKIEELTAQNTRLQLELEAVKAQAARYAERGVECSTTTIVAG